MFFSDSQSALAESLGKCWKILEMLMIYLKNKSLLNNLFLEPDDFLGFTALGRLQVCDWSIYPGSSSLGAEREFGDDISFSPFYCCEYFDNLSREFFCEHIFKQYQSLQIKSKAAKCNAWEWWVIPKWWARWLGLGSISLCWKLCYLKKGGMLIKIFSTMDICFFYDS